MYLAKLQKLGILQTRYQFQHSFLFAITEMVLKTDQSVGVGHHILLSQLHAGPRLAAGFRIRQPARFHRAVSQSIDAATCGFLDRQTALEPMRVLKPL